MNDVPESARQHRRAVPEDHGRVEVPWRGAGGFLRWRSRQLLRQRAWRLVLNAVIALGLVASGLVGGELDEVAAGVRALVVLGLLLVFPPLVTLAAKRAFAVLVRRSRA